MNKKTPKEYLSFSQFSLVRYSEQQFIDLYLKGKIPPPNKYTEFGKKLADRLKSGKISEDKELEAIIKKIPAYERKEVELRVNFTEDENDLVLLGYLDGTDKDITEIFEIKTGQKENMKEWKNQLLFYNLVVYLKLGKLPQKSFLVWAETIEKENKIHFTGKVEIFDIKIEMKDVLLFSVEVKKTWKKIKEITASYFQHKEMDDAFSN